MTNAIAQTSVGVERVRAILDADTVIPERPDGVEPDSLRGEIEFEHVAFGYDDEEPVLHDVCFTIEPGQLVGFVGPTGSGKSTVVSLIPRFYDGSAGSIKDRRRGRPRLQASRTAQAHWLRSAGDRAVPRNHPRQHRVWQSPRD